MSEVPRFKRVILAPSVFKATEAQRSGHRDGTAHQRGYGKRWDKASLAFRKKHTRCEWCLQEGRDEPTAHTDHIIPVNKNDRPDLFWVRDNWWPLCERCHNGRKKAMENYARERGLLDLLPTWCRDPESRPLQFRPIVRSP